MQRELVIMKYNVTEFFRFNGAVRSKSYVWKIEFNERKKYF